jgi:ATP-dependent RNA helicase RhlE
MGHTASEIHSNRSLSQRKEALQGFKLGRYKVLIATDIASRGIDVVGIELVINYDLPENSGDYVHRIGRTARAGALGHAISFATPDQRNELRDIERLVRQNIPVSKTPELPAMPKVAIPPRNETGKNGQNFPSNYNRRRQPHRFNRRKNYSGIESKCVTSVNN